MPFCEVAQHLNDAAKPASNETRIQNFFRDVTLNYLVFARLIISLLPSTGKLRLCLDRTEWDFGQCQVTILLVTVGCGAWHVPLYRELLDNRSGNSNAAQRMAVLEVCVAALGREFVGHAWLKWLKDNGLSFVMRLPKHHLLTAESGERCAIADLGLAVGQVRRFAHRQVDGVWGQVWVKALAEGEFLFLFGTAGLTSLGQFYAKRWTIEQCFQNLKGRGFNLENSHLRSHDKLRKLVALVSLAYAFCLSVGRAADRRAPLPRKNHGYRATSLSRHGLNIVRQLTRPATDAQTKLARIVEALLDWLIKQVARYPISAKIMG
ncbi:IS4-like element ISLpn9 family transposase [Hymenobacter fastidiosus]|uniref:IS4-like element ISLpn9 family transposase n=1 Tax=Hymenobacter fastidiosus TaxID=486264 RepID=A0ABP7RMA6_9BACT